MAMFLLLAASAFAGMAFTPTVGPAFASLTRPPTHRRRARRPSRRACRCRQIDFACKGQAWGAETFDCLRAIAEQSGQEEPARSA